MFVDDLGLQEAFLFFAAVILTYVAVIGWWAIVKNNPERLKGILKGAAIPVGLIGFASLALALWGEMAWPLPASFNILYTDVSLMFSMVLVAFALSAGLGYRLQYAGLFALAAGAVTAFYGWSGYVLGKPNASGSFDMLLLYLGWAAAGISAFPATVIVDHYLLNVAPNPSSWMVPVGASNSRAWSASARASRAVQNLEGRAASDGATASAPPTPLRYRLPIYLNIIMLVFPVFMAIAGFAGLYYLNETIPKHILSAP